MTNGKLEIGDMVYQIKSNIWNRRFDRQIVIGKVVKLTPTMAILDSGVRLINKSVLRENVDAFLIYGDKWFSYKLVTEPIKEDYENQSKAVKAVNWFDTNCKKFTNQQIIEIYNLLNQKQ